MDADVPDGTSNTILHAEKYARCTNTIMLPQFQDGGAALGKSAHADGSLQRPGPKSAG